MTTKRTGLIGYPLGHSLSPAIHRYWIREHGLDASYELFPIAPEEMASEMPKLLASGIHGFNVTVPHKERILDFIAEREDLVKKIGAANTVCFYSDEKKFTCINTDAYGFITNLEHGAKNLSEHLRNVAIFGAGGATRAAIVAFHNAGAKKIVISNRTGAKASKLAAEFGIDSIDWAMRNDVLRDATLLVNTTSLGMQGKPPLELSLKALSATALVHDIVYAPLETPLLAAARARGNPTVDGLGMLLYQAQAAFAAWHGITPEVTAELRAHILSA